METQFRYFQDKMPVSEDSRANQNIDFKQKYRNLKRKLKLLIYENECYNEELQKVQRHLLQVTRDKNFLLDKLINYENFNSTTSDSDATDSSDSEAEIGQVKLENQNSLKRKRSVEYGSSESPTTLTAAKKKKPNPTLVSKIKSTTPVASGVTSTVTTQIKPIRSAVVASTSKTLPNVCQIVTSVPLPTIKTEPATLTPISTPTISTSSTPKASLLSIATNSEGQLTSEEIERHFESRPLQPSLLMPEKTPLTVPVELFSNESSTGLPDERK